MTSVEKILSAINELVDFCNSNNTNITISGGDKIIHLVKDTVGNATYIYGEYGFDNEFFVRLDNKIKLIAIASNNVVYIIDTYMFGKWEIERLNEKLPEGVVWFCDYHKELNDKLTNEFFPQYYASLVPTKIDDYEDERLYEFARIDLLGSGNPKKGIIEKSSLLNDYDIAKILAGFSSKQSAFMDSVSRDVNIYDSKKSRKVATEKYIREHNIVEDYELRIAEAMRNTKAKAVTVWFEKNGKQASTKISPNSVQRVLICKNDYFSCYDFVNNTETNKMFAALGVTNGWGASEKKLFTKDIVKIMYRGKAIYQREKA